MRCVFPHQQLGAIDRRYRELLGFGRMLEPRIGVRLCLVHKYALVSVRGLVREVQWLALES